MNNTAEKRGGAIHNEGNLTVINSSFVNNTVEDKGGAIYGINTMNVFNSSFVNNTANAGGAIYGSGYVSNSSFVNNIASGSAGAVGGNNVNVSNSSFVNNTANAGGAIYGVNSIDVFNSSFVNNTAGGSGGAIYGGSNVNVVNVVNSSFVDNTATRAGAIVARNVNAINSTFMNINTYHGENDIYVVDSVNTSGSVFIESDLAVSVDTLSSIVSSGNRVNFVVTVTNAGSKNNVTGAYVILDLPSDLKYVTLNGAGWSTSDGKKFIYTGNLTPNEKVNFTVVFDALNNGLFDVESLAGSNQTYNVTDSTSVIVDSPGLSVDIVAGDATVNVGDKVNVIVTVKSTGDVINLTNVFVELDIPEGLTYNSHTGNWVRNGNRFVYNGELALNEEVNLTVIFNTVNSGIFTVESNAGSDYASEVSDSASVTVHAPSLSVDIVGDDAVNVSDKVNFTVTVKNTGDVPLTGVFVELNIPDGLTYNSHTGANWIRNGNKFVYDGELALNDVVNFTVVFDTVDLGVFTVDVVSGSDQADNVSDSDRVIVGTPGLSVDVVGDTTVNVGDNVNFTVTVKNTGNIPLSDVFVELDIPDGFICDGVTDGWTQVGNKFYYNDTLNPGEELNFTVSFKPVGTNNNFTISATVGSNEINNTTAIQDTVNVVDESKTNDTDNADMDDVNSTDEPSKTNEINKTIKTSISKSSYDGGIVNTDLATGNPLVVLLACLLMILIPFRKRKH